MFGKYPKVHNIAVNEGNQEPWAFHTIKINNPDMAKSDIRILNDEGIPDFIGRVEFRVSGKWGSVAFEGTSKTFGRYVCRALNYKDGTVLNTSKDFCT